MIKSYKTMSMESFIDKILPFTPWAPYDVQRDALEESAKGNDALFIVRDIEFRIPKEDVDQYYAKNGLESEFGSKEVDGFPDLDSPALAATPPKRKPGRPRIIPDELKSE